MLLLSLLPLVAVVAVSEAAPQVHHHADGRQWSQRARQGPDAEVDGWLYNLGVRGIRVRLVDESPEHLVVGHVFEGSPADGKVRIGDHIVGAGGAAFETPHRNGYGIDVFGPQGPIEDFAVALDAARAADGRKLSLALERGDRELDVTLRLPRKSGASHLQLPTEPPTLAPARAPSRSLLGSEPTLHAPATAPGGHTVARPPRGPKNPRRRPLSDGLASLQPSLAT